MSITWLTRQRCSTKLVSRRKEFSDWSRCLPASRYLYALKKSLQQQQQITGSGIEYRSASLQWLHCQASWSPILNEWMTCSGSEVSRRVFLLLHRNFLLLLHLLRECLLLAALSTSVESNYIIFYYCGHWEEGDELETYWEDIVQSSNLMLAVTVVMLISRACDTDNLIDPLFPRLNRNQSTSRDIPKSSLTGTLDFSKEIRNYEFA